MEQNKRYLPSIHNKPRIYTDRLKFREIEWFPITGTYTKEEFLTKLECLKEEIESFNLGTITKIVCDHDRCSTFEEQIEYEVMETDEQYDERIQKEKRKMWAYEYFYENNGSLACLYSAKSHLEEQLKGTYTLEEFDEMREMIKVIDKKIKE